MTVREIVEITEDNIGFDIFDEDYSFVMSLTPHGVRNSQIPVLDRKVAHIEVDIATICSHVPYITLTLAAEGE